MKGDQSHLNKDVDIPCNKGQKKKKKILKYLTKMENSINIWLFNFHIITLTIV